jgi:hypothetical protein
VTEEAVEIRDALTLKLLSTLHSTKAATKFRHGLAYSPDGWMNILLCIHMMLPQGQTHPLVHSSQDANIPLGPWQILSDCNNNSRVIRVGQSTSLRLGPLLPELNHSLPFNSNFGAFSPTTYRASVSTAGDHKMDPELLILDIQKLRGLVTGNRLLPAPQLLS